MKKIHTLSNYTLVVFALVGCLLLISCDNDDGSDSGASVNVTGSWFGPFTLTLGPVAHSNITHTTKGTTATLTLTQAGDNVVGEIAFTNGPRGPITGSVSQSTFTLNIPDDDCGESASINFAVTDNHMSSTTFSGKLCDNGPKNLVDVTAELDRK